MGLDTVEFVLWAEREFQIDIPDKEAEHILTVGQFSTYAHRKLLVKHGFKAMPEHEVFERIKRHLISAFKVAPEKVNYDSHFVKDLKLDQ